MFDLKKSYGFDAKKAEAGAKMQIGSNPDTDFVLVRRVPNSDYSAELQRLLQSNKKILDYLEKQNPEEFRRLDQKLTAQVAAKTVVVGWGPSFGEDGKIIPYSVEACAELLIKYPDFRRDCLEFASDNRNYPLVADVEDIKKK